MVTIILLFILWFLFWGLYNFVLIKKEISTERGNIKIAIIFASFAVAVFFLSGMDEYVSPLIYLGVWVVLLFLSYITKNKEIGRLSNSLFQMTWFLSISFFLKGNFLLLGSVFFLSHVPILLVKHLQMKVRVLLLLASLVGGVAVAWLLLNISIPYNLVVATLLHYTFYLFLRPIDRKYKMNIIQ